MIFLKNSYNLSYNPNVSQFGDHTNTSICSFQALYKDCGMYTAYKLHLY